MKVVAVGNRSFVAGLRLAGADGLRTDSPDETFEEITRLLRDRDVGLILVSDDVTQGIQDKITAIRAKRSIPLIFEVPAPGSSRENVDYRDMLKQILGV